MSKQELAVSTIPNLWIELESNCKDIGFIAPRLIQVHLDGVVNQLGSLMSYNTIVNEPEYQNIKPPQAVSLIKAIGRVQTQAKCTIGTAVTG